LSTIATHLLPNLAFLAALFCAVRWDMGWLRILVIGFIWVMLAAYLAALHSADGRKKFSTRTAPMPTVLGAAIDAAALVLLLNAGWYLTAAAYCASAAIPVVIFGRQRLLTWTTGPDRP
jgi:hypothetical protein